MLKTSIRSPSALRQEESVENPDFRRANLWYFSSVLLIVVAAVSQAQTQPQAKPEGAELTPQPAVAAILAAFDKYEVVGMPEAHGLKDVDDFILSLIRNPAFPEKVNDIAVECGNSLYQPILDRYIAGEDVPFTEVRKVWRNTTQIMCSGSGFFEEFFPLVRAINQHLPPGKRLRVLAGDPPIDWDQVKTVEDASKFYDRDGSIASVMEKEVLSKHRRALMLFGTFHLMHGVKGSTDPGDAVTIYENKYPNLTFVISDLTTFDMQSPMPSTNPFAIWSVPSLALAKGTWLGALTLPHFFPPPLRIDKDCNAHNDFPEEFLKPMEDLVDAFLYLGLQDLQLREPMPADIALDADYMKESERRLPLQGSPAASLTSNDFAERTVRGAENPIFTIPRLPDPKVMVQRCLDRKNYSSAPQ
jgi:hypothetical protein